MGCTAAGTLILLPPSRNVRRRGRTCISASSGGEFGIAGVFLLFVFSFLSCKTNTYRFSVISLSFKIITKYNDTKTIILSQDLSLLPILSAVCLFRDKSGQLEESAANEQQEHDDDAVQPPEIYPSDVVKK